MSSPNRHAKDHVVEKSIGSPRRTCKEQRAVSHFVARQLTRKLPTWRCEFSIKIVGSGF